MLLIVFCMCSSSDLLRNDSTFLEFRAPSFILLSFFVNVLYISILPRPCGPNSETIEKRSVVFMHLFYLEKKVAEEHEYHSSSQRLANFHNKTHEAMVHSTAKPSKPVHITRPEFESAGPFDYYFKSYLIELYKHLEKKTLNTIRFGTFFII